MPEEIKDKDIKINDKTVGFSSIVKLNVKTLFWFFGILYVLAGYAYYDLRKDLKESSTVLKDEKQEFFNGVQTTLYKDIGDIKVGMESMKGDIRIILDRQNRDNPVVPTNTAVQPVFPPPITTPPDTTGQ